MNRYRHNPKQNFNILANLLVAATVVYTIIQIVKHEPVNGKQPSPK